MFDDGSYYLAIDIPVSMCETIPHTQHCMLFEPIALRYLVGKPPDFLSDTQHAIHDAFCDQIIFVVVRIEKSRTSELERAQLTLGLQNYVVDLLKTR